MKLDENKPLISIVTVVFNGAETLEETIQSVINQTYDNIEYIIIDGGSTDGTIDIIKKYEDRINYWISESDSGIYDAMNKGIQCAQGEYLFFLNSDDVFIQSNMKVLFEKIMLSRYDIIHGNIFIKESKIIIKPLSKKKSNSIGNIEPWLMQPASFIKKNVYNRIGNFDTKFKISGDTDLLIRVIKHNFNDYYINLPFTIFSNSGISGKLIFNKEHLYLRKKHSINYLLFIKTELIMTIKKVFMKLFT